MASTYDCSDQTSILHGMRFAKAAVQRGELLVIPTDTVYGVAADAFRPEAVERLLNAKGRTRQSPPPVLIPNLAAMGALGDMLTEDVKNLAREFWPGALTIIVPAQPSLAWDLGETNGTVALRIPDHEITLQLLAETGPLAVSSANKTGEPAATTVQDAEAQLGDLITVYLDAGATPGNTPSTIIDATAHCETGAPITIVRQGAISESKLKKVAPAAFGVQD